ncbi:MAG: hypothetical protein JRF59_03385 [Deltaproteobacteria bacterium]|nr:hypothetical protein [Deltaproteobacteria bacterium]MBW2346870.1 hypothetical protein [Deltaproteobacteria bacterium]
MEPTASPTPETAWIKSPFRLVKPDEFHFYGIDPQDVPLGTFPALRHPAQLISRFGGNAYGFGLFEVYDRLNKADMDFLQSVNLEDPDQVRLHYRDLNRIYKNLGLLIRFSSRGKPYYLIPAHLVSATLSHVKSKVNEISKIVGYHRRKYLQEHHDIGLVTHRDDLIFRELSSGFKEHHFVLIDSLDRLKALDATLDLIVVTRDLYELITMEGFSPLALKQPDKARLEQYALFLLWEIFNRLKPDGEIFIIANRYVPRSNKTAKVRFKSEAEEKNYALFSHIFKTRRRFHRSPGGGGVQVNQFDFQQYLSDLYVEQETVNRLLGGRTLEEMTLEEIENLPYMDFRLSDRPYTVDQEKTWSRLLSVYFQQIFLKPLIPDNVRSNWDRRFSCHGFAPHYMLIYLGQKRPLKTTLSKLKEEVSESQLAGCPLSLLADYRDSFEYVIDTLQVLERLKQGRYEHLPRVFIDRLKQPLDNKKRRFPRLNAVVKLVSKAGRLERIKKYMNPDGIQGSRTRILENLEALPFFGFSHEEVREIFLIVTGHTAMGRIISGKMNEKALKPLSDLARRYDAEHGLNLLRYCRLMTMAETVAARGRELNQGQLAELFDLYEATVRVATNRELDWDGLLDERISSLGGIHNKIVRKILKMANHFEFLDNWAELREKGPMEKEALADYDEAQVSRIESIIHLLETIELVEQQHLKLDPVELPAFYRKFLGMEFHGTGHLFQRMDSGLVFVLLWITVNVVRGDVINFNPILADVQEEQIEERIRRVEQEAARIRIQYLDLESLRQFSKQVYENHSAFIVGSGFQLRVNRDTQALEILYVDLDQNIEDLRVLSRKWAGHTLNDLPLEDLERIEALFSHLESFYQGHLRLTRDKEMRSRLPARQRKWFQQADTLRESLKSDLLQILFRPEALYTDLNLLHRHAPSILNFILPEFTALRKADLSGRLYLKTSVTEYILNSARKLQALIRGRREDFQNVHFLHHLAQREFGPMATGIVGVNESQIQALEHIVAGLAASPPLFEALAKAVVLQDLARVPELRDRYRDVINPADLGNAGAVILEKEGIPERLQLGEEARNHLLFLVRHHSDFHHMIRGEMGFAALENILRAADPDLLDALFVLSFIMLSALGEDLVLEDLAARLFRIRGLCRDILEGKTTLDLAQKELFRYRGGLFFALQHYDRVGLPEGVSAGRYLDSGRWPGKSDEETLRAGERIFAMERLFRLHGIRYVEFVDLVNLMVKVPLKFIYKKRKLSSIGYASYEREVYEAFRIYRTLQNLDESIRHFMLDRLLRDRVRVFGYEKVSDFLSYQNQLKLILAGLVGTTAMEETDGSICINYTGMADVIEKRYEAVNDFLNGIPMERIWANKARPSRLFKAKSGVLLKTGPGGRVLSVEFQDKIHMERKVSYMQTIDDLDQLKNYFHYSLRSLRKHPFPTEDYELALERAFEERLERIIDSTLAKAAKQMELIQDFAELHHLAQDLGMRSLDMGFSSEQRHRLQDLYEIRKDNLRRKKLREIEVILDSINDAEELRDYWNSIKWYLQQNRPYLGKEFENLIARKFDLALERLSALPASRSGP